MKTTKPAQPKPSLEEWAAVAARKTSCVICRSAEALAWVRSLREIVAKRGSIAPPLEAQAERISEDVGFLVTPSQLRKHRRSCERAEKDFAK